MNTVRAETNPSVRLTLTITIEKGGGLRSSESENRLCYSEHTITQLKICYTRAHRIPRNAGFLSSERYVNVRRVSHIRRTPRPAHQWQTK